MWNHFIALPWLYDLINPDLFPHDPLIAQREISPSFYNSFLKALSPLFGNDIPLMHFVLFSIVHLLTFTSFYFLAASSLKIKGPHFLDSLR
ncbi:MAG: hypothetical protein U5L96_15600 [Owenweeksia sp.]|nr:hypothetical protein [Owenweeksia sp.]